MEYLSDPSAPVPKTTKYRHIALENQSEKRRSIENDAPEAHISEFEKEPLDFESTYTDMFDFQQTQTNTEACDDEHSIIELEELVTRDLDSEMVHVFESDWGEWDSDIKLEDTNLFEDFNDREPVNEGASLTFHDLAVLLITLKTSFNVTSITLSFIIKIISLVLPPERRGKLRSLKQLYAYFNSQDLSFRKHYYCQNCEFYLGLDKDSIEKQGCPSCGKKNTDKYFVDIPLEAELQKNLERK